MSCAHMLPAYRLARSVYLVGRLVFQLVCVITLAVSAFGRHLYSKSQVRDQSEGADGALVITLSARTTICDRWHADAIVHGLRCSLCEQ